MRFGGKLERRAGGAPLADLVGLDAARRFAGCGWRSVRAFLLAPAAEVALRSGVPEDEVRRLQDAHGLRAVRGLGPRGVECLVAVGVRSRAGLAAADPADLARRLAERLGAEAPPSGTVASWVAAARAT